jgi:hypothetical protein
MAMPQERSRTVTTYSSDARHDHYGKGNCNGKLIADDQSLRFESVGERITREPGITTSCNRSIRRKTRFVEGRWQNGEKYDFKMVNGKTAGGLYDLVAQKIVAARTAK